MGLFEVFGDQLRLTHAFAPLLRSALQVIRMGSLAPSAQVVHRRNLIMSIVTDA